MIKNAHQASEADKSLAEFKQAADSSTGADRDIYLALADQVGTQLSEYRSIVDGYTKSFEIASLDDLPDALVKARLSRGWTQKALAVECGVSEQMVQRDEAGAYERAQLFRLAEIIDALGYRLKGCLQPITEEPGGIHLSPGVVFTNNLVVGWSSPPVEAISNVDVVVEHQGVDA